MENHNPTILWPEWPRVPALLFLWLESRDCYHCHHHLVILVYPLCLSSEVGGWQCSPAPHRCILLLPMWTDGSCSVYLWAQALPTLAITLLRKCGEFWPNKKLKSEAVKRLKYCPLPSRMNFFWRWWFPHSFSRGIRSDWRVTSLSQYCSILYLDFLPSLSHFHYLSLFILSPLLSPNKEPIYHVCHGLFPQKPSLTYYLPEVFAVRILYINPFRGKWKYLEQNKGKYECSH